MVMHMKKLSKDWSIELENIVLTTIPFEKEIGLIYWHAFEVQLSLMSFDSKLICL